MRYGSVCSGIEAATVAWHALGWEPVSFSEIEPFPCAVLQHHYPDVPNLGDMTKFKEWPDAAIDLLVGGTPCQSFSVAGLRKGLDDPRGNLMLTFGAIAGRFKPTWIVWENVPGVLSSNGGRDFGTFLGMLAELGYGFSYRVLDAQYFGVAQRRRRVFVVGYLGDWRRAAAVLFERESLCRNPAPSREKGKGTAACVARSLTRRYDSSEDGTGRGLELICMAHGQGGAEICNDGSPSLSCNHEAPICAYPINTLTPGGRPDPINDARMTIGVGEDGDPQFTIQAEHSHAVAYTKGENNGSAQEAHPGTILRVLREEVGEEAFTKWGLGILGSLQSSEILRQALHGIGIRPASFSRDWMVYCALSREKGDPSWLVQSLRETECEGCPPQGWEPSEQLSRKLRTYLSELSQPGTQAQRFMRDLWGASEGPGILREALSAIQEMGRSSRSEGQPVCSMQVRRLTATECEFLQGFPRNYTLIPYRNKPAADGPRYKALGNSMAVPVMRWIGERIQLIESKEWTA